ncbi:4Fe-4S binding protein [Patulibacter sp.]|uniref:4Fe-4S binding protein n=1 Tax=Patulibacter sp. TaxID=1912859 RepID=UPI00271BC1EF|nr:4Fe-4S binding protein [Patulibacter sp.]MDO9408982.1 4Fe-4S binding protein [Patulibacter sp.]
MPHVVTQSCVGDGSCVFACPVNCIQPSPDDPAFELAEMLHVDPTSCMDCGACISACPVDAIKPHTQLTEEERVFAGINADYYAVPKARPVMAPMRPRLVVKDRGEPLRVAIVGSGPAAMYAAEELLTVPGAHVDVYERLDRPFGLVRSGVAPDHRRTRRVSRQMERISTHERLTLHLGVEIGRDVTHDGLLQDHHAVIYAVGAASDRRLEIPGAELPGVFSATELVGWYNGHPDHAERTPDLSHRRAVVIGNGNVALDVARVLTQDPEALVDSEIAPHALQALRESRIEEVVVVARRGVEAAAFTLPELVGLRSTPGVALDVPDAELAAVAPGHAKADLLRSLPPAAPGDRRIALRFLRNPTQVVGDGAVEALEVERTTIDEHGVLVGTGELERLDAGLIVTSIGYRGLPVGELPYDAARGVVPNAAGRVVDPATAEPHPGTYVAGWIKRGPSGFIGTNKGCSQDTVAALIDDWNAGALGSLPAPAARPGTPEGRQRRARLRALAGQAFAGRW